MSVVGASRLTARRVALDGVALAVHDVPPASGTPARGTVVLVPGFTGSKEDFAPVADLLAAAGHRYVALDLRGQHESDGPDDPAAYAVEVLAADLLMLCGTLGDGPVHLVGHSFGGLVVRAAALARPAAVRSVTLLASGPAAVVGATAVRARTLCTLLETMSLPEISDLAEATDPVLATRPAAVRAFLRARFLAHSRAGLLGMGEAILAEPDRVYALRATGLPVLVAYGADDDAWPPATQASMAQRLGAVHAVIAGAVHSPAVEAPGETARVLTLFWADVESRA